MFATVLEVAGLVAVAVAAFLVSPVLGLFVAGVLAVAVGYLMED